MFGLGLFVWASWSGFSCGCVWSWYFCMWGFGIGRLVLFLVALVSAFLVLVFSSFDLGLGRGPSD